MTTHTTSPIRQMPENENGRGNLAGFEARCSCGLVMRHQFRVSLLLDIRQHEAWHKDRVA